MSVVSPCCFHRLVGHFSGTGYLRYRIITSQHLLSSFFPLLPRQRNIAGKTDILKYRFSRVPLAFASVNMKCGSGILTVCHFPQGIDQESRKPRRQFVAMPDRFRHNQKQITQGVVVAANSLG